MFEGTTTALVTPFKQNGELDLEGLKKNVRFQVAGGINGLLALGTTGESPTLSEQEKEQVVKATVAEARGKAPVMVGSGTNDTRKTVKASQLACDWGADALLVVTPYYNKPTPKGIYEHFKAVNDAVDRPIVVYNIAGRTGKNIETQVMKRLAELEHIIGVKEASGNIDQIGDVCREIQATRKGFTVWSGDDGLTFPAMALGAKGVISVASNLVPARVVAMTTAALQGKWEEARRLHFELLPLFKGIFIETNPIPIKAAMNWAGLAAGAYRLPMTEMEPQNAEKLRALLKSLGLLKG
ncbi:MAG TPA: 4-hydroxy-tetrahydrodipicolinate synthase [Candidatus Diapherotrites archaeon]|uniref:4-hydroxy-tetrahydrodipicolinate synthase n=1 Tax=Candidatus Iainarchaeum sp. TaxID=3101447 RepID=A0A7J4JHD1_9ARCH|nr:4-hydroxy-tetrahydrodipicolinate synthase [Candidatus Diapherotrites archaeon]HIH15805.1 4-hydroxy-tetrahydrodipicolinate synthase [Candidatus Diapherotrites archaeon]